MRSPKMWSPRVHAMCVISLWLFMLMFSPVKMEQQGGNPTETHSDQVMTYHSLTNKSVTCNDGSPAGYYIKASNSNSKRWQVYLEGGYQCFDKTSCDARYVTDRRLMSSTVRPREITGYGIMSGLRENNPHWWNANIVYVPYCSSDTWTGESPKTTNSDYAFMGALIVQEVVKDLLGQGLDQAEVLMLSGSSAGAIGVLFNVDRVAEQLKNSGHPGVKVRGFADSGWFLKLGQYIATNCTGILQCEAEEFAKQSLRYWGTKVSDSCPHAHNGEEWRCSSADVMYSALKSPVFVMQYGYDLAQLAILNTQLGPPITEDKMRFIQSYYRTSKASLEGVPALFFANCVDHVVICYDYWTDVVVKGTSLTRAVDCWERSLDGDGRSSGRGCPMRLVDSCNSLHCNPTCPSTIAGQKMSAADYLKVFGFGH